MRLRTWVTPAIICALFSGCIYAEIRAEANAKAFCSRFTVGVDFNKAVEAADASDAYHNVVKDSGENSLFVMYMGIPPFSRHICFIEGVGGKIVRLSQKHFD